MCILWTSIFSGKWMSMIIYMTIRIWKDLFRLIIFHMYRDENSDTTIRNTFSLFPYINSFLCSAKLVFITSNPSYIPFENCISDRSQNATLKWLYQKSFMSSLKSYLLWVTLYMVKTILWICSWWKKNLYSIVPKQAYCPLLTMSVNHGCTPN